MDVLSDAIGVMRTGRTHSSCTRNRNPWGVRFGPFAGAGFHVVLQGSCWLRPTGGEPVHLGAGDVAFLPHGRGHGLSDALSTSLVDVSVNSLAEPQGRYAEPAAPRDGVGQDAETILLCGGYLLDQARPHPLMSSLPEVIHLPARIGRDQALKAAVELLGKELQRPMPGANAVLSALLDVLLLYILRVWFTEQSELNPDSGWGAALADPAIIAALRAIHDTPTAQWTVEQLAARAGLSRAAFARRFSDLIGQPPLSYLTWWRMTTAARLLRTTEEPLSTISAQVGYTSEFAFAKAFKRACGTAPGSYRRHQRDLYARGRSAERAAITRDAMVQM